VISGLSMACLFCVVAAVDLNVAKHSLARAPNSLQPRRKVDGINSQAGPIDLIVDG
jgi:hypothetical protein